jgi:hypothetical protein
MQHPSQRTREDRDAPLSAIYQRELTACGDETLAAERAEAECKRRNILRLARAL